jgi:hypothetical protein
MTVLHGHGLPTLSDVRAFAIWCGLRGLTLMLSETAIRSDDDDDAIVVDSSQAS